MLANTTLPTKYKYKHIQNNYFTIFASQIKNSHNNHKTAQNSPDSSGIVFCRGNLSSPQFGKNDKNG